MKKEFTITYTISFPHQIAITAESEEDALDFARENYEKVLEDFAEKTMDYSNGDVQFENVYDEEGNLIY